ncbi:hypothetical protein AB6A40_005954 [Gnathostoma spinigerum]|uniref:PBZ-type domain-containing protein n=1 Tax=Gnathostoma spinigerum TaxID=75299 RepID=A0ABD6ESL6_9BILA
MNETGKLVKQRSTWLLVDLIRVCDYFWLQLEMLQQCRFGANCYRKKNAKHMARYSHNNEENQSDPFKTDEDRHAIEKRPKLDYLHDLQIIDELFLVKHSNDIIKFWEHAIAVAGESEARNAFKSLDCLRLEGVFDYLAQGNENNKDASENYWIISCRYETDLPEMETFATCSSGRFAFWRDTPECDTPLIVFVAKQMKHFPKLEIVGTSDPTYILLYLMTETCKTKRYLTLLPEGWSRRMSAYETERRKWNAARRKTSLGHNSHGMGIVVKVTDDVGYRPLGISQAELKKKIEDISSCSDEVMKNARKESLVDIFSNVQFANDEMDFGMGLEFGHELFMSNYCDVDRMAVSVLTTAYTLLERSAFAKILKAHTDVRRKHPSE